MAQKCVDQPLLWPPVWHREEEELKSGPECASTTETGKRKRGDACDGIPRAPQYKFHLRVYAALFGDGRLLVYTNALAHVANHPHTLPAHGFNPEAHITNVCANVHGTQFHPFPTVHLPKECATMWSAICESLSALATRCMHRVQRQLSRQHFALLGVDFLPCAESSTPWLLEVNAPPCLSAQCGDATLNKRLLGLLTPMIVKLLRAANMSPSATNGDNRKGRNPECAQGARRQGGEWVETRQGSASFAPSDSFAHLKQDRTAWEKERLHMIEGHRQEWMSRSRDITALHPATQPTVDWGRTIKFSSAGGSRTAAAVCATTIA